MRCKGSDGQLSQLGQNRSALSRWRTKDSAADRPDLTALVDTLHRPRNTILHSLSSFRLASSDAPVLSKASETLDMTKAASECLQSVIQLKVYDMDSLQAQSIFYHLTAIRTKTLRPNKQTYTWVLNFWSSRF